MGALTSPILIASVVGGILFALGLWVGRRRVPTERPAPADQSAIDFGSAGRKKAKVGKVLFHRDWVCTIYGTDFLYLNRYPHRHIMEVPVDISAVSISVGILLTAWESAKVEAGDDWPYFEHLAEQVRDNPFRFRNTLIERPSRSVA